jgi:hypothetical protein
MPGQKISHGRGGAGNISADNAEYVDGLTYSPPVLTEKRNHHYTTGIGGAGNIRKYNAEEVRVAQDVPEGPFRAPRATAAGRGGYGNLREFHKRERIYEESLAASARTSEESNHTVTSAASNTSRASSISDIGFANWSKHLIMGTKI